MKRLTTVPQASMIKCCGCIEESNCYSDISCDEIFKGIKKLKAYEDTGLEPEDILATKRAMETQHWISVSERLPKLEEYKSATEDGEYFSRLEIAALTGGIEYYIGYFDGYKWFDKRHRTLNGDVVAWKVHQPYKQ
ncbi:hypothetical protein AALB39_03925 [Lachnospiraceae bacterium 54-53]